MCSVPRADVELVRNSGFVLHHARHTPASTVAVAKPAPKRRRISNTRAESTLQIMLEDAERDEFEVELQWVVDQCKNSPHVLKLCKAAIKKHYKATMDQTTLKRGVSTLLSTPDYVIRAALSRMTGRDESTFRSMAPEEYRCLWYWGMNGTPGLRLPSKEMLISEFMAWVDTMHESGGYRIRNLAVVPEETLDWELELGDVNFLRPEGRTDPATPITRIRCKSGDCTKVLDPSWGPVKLGDLGSTHHIINNYSIYEAMLVIGGATHNLAYFFNVVAQAG